MILRHSIPLLALVLAAQCFGAVSEDLRDEDIEIVEGEHRTIYEYRVNGLLMMIKVVPENGRPYYMVPADGSPHYENLDYAKNLYPRWVIIEW